jgi:hypothetical protein
MMLEQKTVIFENLHFRKSKLEKLPNFKQAKVLRFSQKYVIQLLYLAKEHLRLMDLLSAQTQPD